MNNMLKEYLNFDSELLNDDEEDGTEEGMGDEHEDEEEDEE